MWTRRILVAVVCLTSALSAAAQEEPELGKDIPEIKAYFGSVTGKIVPFLKSKNETSIAVAFASPANFPSSAGDGFTQMLAENLKAKASKSCRARFAYQGEFKPGKAHDARGRGSRHPTASVGQNR